MKIIVLGAGALGSAYGALLSRKYDVLLIGRKAHVDKINSSGLIIEGEYAGNYKLKAKEEIDEIPENCLLILSTKVVDNEESIKAVKDKLKDDTTILCLQNGLGNEKIIQNIVPNKVIRGITNSATTFLEPGKIFLDGLNILFIDDNEVAGVFKTAELPAEYIEDLNPLIWKKLILNCIVNPITALTGERNKSIALPEFKEIEDKIYNECLVCAEKQGIKFNEDLMDSFFKAMEGSENKSSMLQDIEKSKRTEIDYLNGAIVKIAEDNNFEVPMNKIVTELVRLKSGN